MFAQTARIQECARVNFLNKPYQALRADAKQFALGIPTKLPKNV
jgi:hypothetical protein